MTRSKVSKRYAKALLSLGLEDGRYQEYGEELRAFADFYESYGELNQAITNPAFTLEDRKEILKGVLARSATSETIRNFLNLLLDKNRISALGEISALYEQLTGKKVRMNVRQDKSILGGIIAKIGDLVVDGSVKSQVQRIKESLKRGE